MNVVKAEKICCMRTRLNPLSFFNGQSAAKAEKQSSTTIPSVNKDIHNRSTAQASG
nr:MAG TPA: hypothetical protein [Caudoviricetes sp.]